MKEYNLEYLFDPDRDIKNENETYGFREEQIASSFTIDDNGNLILNSDAKVIDKSISSHIEGCEKIIIPEGVEVIGPLSFAESEVKEVVCPSSLQLIDQYAFHNSKIVKITLNSGLKVIGPNAFGKCRFLKEIEISSTVIAIGELAFAICRSLNRIILPKMLKFVGKKVFWMSATNVEIYDSTDTSKWDEDWSNSLLGNINYIKSKPKSKDDKKEIEPESFDEITNYSQKSDKLSKKDQFEHSSVSIIDKRKLDESKRFDVLDKKTSNEFNIKFKNIDLYFYGNKWHALTKPVPKDLQKKVDTLFNFIFENYPDRIVIGLKKLSAAKHTNSRDLKNKLGYETIQDFFNDFGFYYDYDGALASQLFNSGKTLPNKVKEESIEIPPDGPALEVPLEKVKKGDHWYSLSGRNKRDYSRDYFLNKVLGYYPNRMIYHFNKNHKKMAEKNLLYLRKKYGYVSNEDFFADYGFTYVTKPITQSDMEKFKFYGTYASDFVNIFQDEQLGLDKLVLTFFDETLDKEKLIKDFEDRGENLDSFIVKQFKRIKYNKLLLDDYYIGFLLGKISRTFEKSEFSNLFSLRSYKTAKITVDYMEVSITDLFCGYVNNIEYYDELYYDKILYGYHFLKSIKNSFDYKKIVMSLYIAFLKKNNNDNIRKIYNLFYEYGIHEKTLLPCLKDEGDFDIKILDEDSALYVDQLVNYN